MDTELERRLMGDLPENWDADLPIFPADSKGMATRAASGNVINALAGRLPELIGGSADLAPSNNTWIKDTPAFQKDNPWGTKFPFWGARTCHGCDHQWNGGTWWVNSLWSNFFSVLRLYAPCDKAFSTFPLS